MSAMKGRAYGEVYGDEAYDNEIYGDETALKVSIWKPGFKSLLTFDATKKKF